MRKGVLPSILCTAVSHFSHYAISPRGHIQFMTGIWLRLDEMLNCNQTPAILCSLHFGHLPLKKMVFILLMLGMCCTNMILPTDIGQSDNRSDVFILSALR